MSSGNPLGPVADAGRGIEQALGRAIAAADREWADSARRAFDAQHLESITAGAAKVTRQLADMGERLRTASALLKADDG